MKRFLLTAAFSALAAAATAGSDWTTGGFEMPESALVNPATGQIIVSNIKGNPGEADGDGYLSLVSPKGAVIDQVWAEGLDAPKGMALVGDRLYVADLTNLRVLDATTGALLETVAAEGAVFLNDVTTDGEAVYLSDMMTHTIWRFADGALSPWMESAALEHPNGLLWDDGRLLVGSWGTEIQEDFTTKTAGALLAVDPTTQEIEVLTDKLGNLDGIVRIGETLYVSDWIAGTVYAVAEDGAASEVAQFGAGAADMGLIGETIVIPHMLEGKLQRFEAGL